MILLQSWLDYGSCDKVPFGCLPPSTLASSDSADSSGSLALAAFQSFWYYKDKPFENMEGTQFSLGFDLLPCSLRLTPVNLFFVAVACEISFPSLLL